MKNKFLHYLTSWPFIENPVDNDSLCYTDKHLTLGFIKNLKIHHIFPHWAGTNFTLWSLEAVIY